VFAIELLLICDGTDPVIIDRMISTASDLADADKIAKALLEHEQWTRPHNAPGRISYRIIGGAGTVVRTELKVAESHSRRR
jgi:hypothetical protein